MSEPWTFSSATSGYRGATAPWLPSTNETWRRDLLANRSGANEILDLQQSIGQEIERLRNQGLIENLRKQQSLLQSYQPGQALNLYDQPANQRDALRNQLINRDIKGQEALLMAGLRSYPQRRREYAEDLQIAQRRQDMGLDRAKLALQARRDRQNQALALQRLGLEEQKAGQLNAYRNQSLRQRGQIADKNLQARTAADEMRTYDRDLKAASDAVLMGMDPGDAADLFDIAEEDVPRLQGYGDLYAEGEGEDDALAEQIALILNSESLSRRQKMNVPAGTALRSLDPGDAAELDAQMLKLGGAGLVRRNGAFYEPIGRSAAPSSVAPVQNAGGYPVLSPAQAGTLAPGSKYRDLNGRLRVKQSPRQAYGFDVIPDQTLGVARPVRSPAMIDQSVRSSRGAGSAWDPLSVLDFNVSPY